MLWIESLLLVREEKNVQSQPAKPNQTKHSFQEKTNQTKHCLQDKLNQTVFSR